MVFYDKYWTKNIVRDIKSDKLIYNIKLTT